MRVGCAAVPAKQSPRAVRGRGGCGGPRGAGEEARGTRVGVSPAQLSEDFFLSPQFSRSRASVTPRFASLDLSRMPAFGWRGRQEAGIRELRCVGLACGSGGEASSGLLADFACCLCLLLAPRALVRWPRACVRAWAAAAAAARRGVAWRGCACVGCRVSTRPRQASARPESGPLRRVSGGNSQSKFGSRV